MIRDSYVSLKNVSLYFLFIVCALFAWFPIEHLYISKSLIVCGFILILFVGQRALSRNKIGFLGAGVMASPKNIHKIRKENTKSSEKYWLRVGFVLFFASFLSFIMRLILNE